MAPVTDHYWWVQADFGLKNAYGETPKAYIADSWLKPIRPEKMHETEEEDIGLEA